MRTFIDDLEVRAGRLLAVREHPQPHSKPIYDGGETVVATVWLAFYLLALGTAVSSPVLSHAIELAAR
jgi:hypothetical protein